jgi:hypothetical protein
MYERFWDLHLAAGSEFDFPNDIAEYARYQRQLKTNHKIAGPALLLIEQFGAWGKSAALLLSRFEGIEVWVEADMQGMINDGVPGLMLGLNAIEPAKKTIQLKLPSRLAKVAPTRRPGDVPEGRFVFVDNSKNDSNNPDEYEHAYKCEQNPTYGVYIFRREGKQANGDVVVFGIPRISETLRGKLLTEKLANAGYLGTMVDFNDVDKTLENSAVRSAVQWLTGKPSKLRINAHGDGEGNLEMGIDASNKRKMSTTKMVDWLVANGLKERGQWKTFSIFVCMAARYKDVPAGTEDAVSSPATQSAVWAVADALRKKEINGVKVTGANEVTWGVSHVDGIETTGGFQPGQSVQMIAIPQGWTFDQSNLTLTVPNDWKIEQLTHQGKRRIILTLTQTGAKVAPNPGTGWDFEVQGTKHVIPLAGWTVDKEKAYLIATDGWRAEGGQKLRYQGSGGMVGLRKASGTVSIIERLAKSGAKFAEIS